MSDQKDDKILEPAASEDVDHIVAMTVDISRTLQTLTREKVAQLSAEGRTQLHFHVDKLWMVLGDCGFDENLNADLVSESRGRTDEELAEKFDEMSRDLAAEIKRRLRAV